MKKLLASLLFLAFDGFAQVPASAADTTQLLLAEVRQLRLAIEGMTAASQRVQIALYTLQMQDSAVSRAAKRLEDARQKCAAVDRDRQAANARGERFELPVPGGPLDVERRTMLAEFKREVEAKTNELRTCQAAEAEAAGQLRNDQAKLTELQDCITRLDSALAALSSGK